MPIVKRPCPLSRVTNGPCQHFFGYYDKTPWDADDRRLLALRVAFMQRQPGPQDVAQIGMLDTQRGNRWRPLAETRAWCWQQGSMLQWLPTEPRRKIIFNTRRADAALACILDIESGDGELLPRPLYAPAPQGAGGLSLNFARLYRTRPGYGYAGIADPSAGQCAPDDDGVWYLDLNSTASRLIITLAQLADHEADDSMQGVAHWVNHLQWNPSGSRFALLHRWPGGHGFRTRLFTASPDGGDLTLLEDSGRVSHYDWRDDEHLLAWSTHCGATRFHLYHDPSGAAEVFAGDLLSEDGHISFSPDRQWLLTDTYPTRGARRLMLYHPAGDTRYDLGRFHSDPAISGALRCDLHPRWNRAGTQVCIDSAHEGRRQIYILDVSAIVS